MTRELALDQQIKGMARDWPQFKRLRRPKQGGTSWIGQLRPQLDIFTVEISYGLHFDFPHVRVIAPALLHLPENPEGALPHVYPPSFVSPPAKGIILCLFDPNRNEWDKTMPISKTTVPWTIDWLSCYEWWTMTGQWVGGGRHAGCISPQANEVVI